MTREQITEIRCNKCGQLYADNSTPQGATIDSMKCSCGNSWQQAPRREQIEAAAILDVQNVGISGTSYQIAIAKFVTGALWMQSQMQAQKEQWQREAWSAAQSDITVHIVSPVETEVSNGRFEDWKERK